MMDRLMQLALAIMLIGVTISAFNAKKRGYEQCKAEQAVRDAQGYQELIERMRNADIDTDDPDAVDRFLRELAGISGGSD